MCNASSTSNLSIDMQAMDLKRYYGLHFITSSLEKKAEAAAAVKEKLDHDATRVPPATVVAAKSNSGNTEEAEQKHPIRSSLAYVAASTMTAMVAAGEKEKQEAARDLQSLHSAPCEWFVCDDVSTYTRCFVIQVNDSFVIHSILSSH